MEEKKRRLNKLGEWMGKNMSHCSHGMKKALNIL